MLPPFFHQSLAGWRRNCYNIWYYHWYCWSIFICVPLYSITIWAQSDRLVRGYECDSLSIWHSSSSHITSPCFFSTLIPTLVEVYPPLFLDYCSALSAVAMTIYVTFKFYDAGYLLNEHVVNALISGAVSVASFVTSWKYEIGVLYLIFHGLWHVLSAAAVNEIGIAEKILHVLWALILW